MLRPSCDASTFHLITQQPQRDEWMPQRRAEIKTIFEFKIKKKGKKKNKTSKNQSDREGLSLLPCRRINNPIKRPEDGATRLFRHCGIFVHFFFKFTFYQAVGRVWRKDCAGHRWVAEEGRIRRRPWPTVAGSTRRTTISPSIDWRYRGRAQV